MRGRTGRMLWNVLSQLRILAGGNVFAGMGPAAETGCKSVTLFLYKEAFCHNKKSPVQKIKTPRENAGS